MSNLAGKANAMTLITTPIDGPIMALINKGILLLPRHALVQEEAERAAHAIDDPLRTLGHSERARLSAAQ